MVRHGQQMRQVSPNNSNVGGGGGRRRIIRVRRPQQQIHHTRENENIDNDVPTLMAKHCLEVGRKSRFLPNLRHETCLHGAVKVLWMDLQSCWMCSSTCYTPIQCQTTTIVAPT